MIRQSKNRIVILGSNGFVASAVKEKIKNEFKIKCISRKEVDFLKKDAVNKLKSIIQKDDLIFFAAAVAPVKNENMLIDNLIMCKNICDALNDILIRKIIYLSSDAVYSDKMSSLNESSTTNPDSLHGIMHLTREKILLNTFKTKVCIVRPTLIYGYSDPHNGYGPNMFIRLVKKNLDINLFGKGEEKRDHVWIEDVAFVISFIIKNNVSGIYNISSGSIISFYEIANLVIKNIESNSKIIFNIRKFSMPHNGYRPISNKKILNKIGKYKFIDLKNYFSNNKFSQEIDLY